MKDSVKKTIKSALALLLVFCLTACGSASVAGNSQPKVSAEEETIADAVPAKVEKSFKSKANPTVKVEDDKTTPAATNPTEETAFAPQTSFPPIDTSSEDSLTESLKGTYWKAIECSVYDPNYGSETVSKMPTDIWWADLFLNEDGSMQFREVVDNIYERYILDYGRWWAQSAEMLSVGCVVSDMAYNLPEQAMNVYIRGDDGLILDFNGKRLMFFEQAERPAPGEEACPADLQGIWQMTQEDVGNGQYDPREQGKASLLSFENRWDSMGEAERVATIYQANSLNTNHPEYIQKEELSIEVLDEPLYQGLGNPTWSAHINTTDYDVFLSDRNTLYLQERNGSSVVRTAIYEKTEWVPEDLQQNMEKPDGAVIYYYPNPPKESLAHLQAIPPAELEPNAQDLLMLIGVGYVDQRVQFYTGEPVWNDDGTLQDWKQDKILYDGIIKSGKVLKFSLTIPKDAPKLCMGIKDNYHQDWSYWPITEMNGYQVEAGTFLISGQ